MKWANKSLEELEEIYWDQIAPEFRNDGYDPTTVIQLSVVDK
jgi:hypothetical protein